MSSSLADYAAISRQALDGVRLRTSQKPVTIHPGSVVGVMDERYVGIGFDSLAAAVRICEETSHLRRQYIEIFPDGTWRQVDRNGDRVEVST